MTNKKPNGDAKAAEAPAERKMKPLKGGTATFALEYGGFSQNTFRALPDKDTELEDLVKPEFWIYVSKSLNTWDRVIVIVPEKMWAEVLVLNHEPMQVQVLRSRGLDKVLATDAAAGIPKDYDVVRIADTGKYLGIRKADSWPMTAERSTFEEARRELLDHNIFRQRA